jgi:predicted NBD/HSP70 family sugar kinase
MSRTIDATPNVKPVLDPDFQPAVVWNKKFLEAVRESDKKEKFIMALERSNGAVSTFASEIFPHEDPYKELNIKYAERALKTLLWLKGGAKITIAGNQELVEEISKIYSAGGKREFDCQIMGKIYGEGFKVLHSTLENLPHNNEMNVSLGGNMDGCRIGFDLGGSDRKCAAVKDGEVVFTEEIKWDPYFEKDPSYHLEGIRDSLKRAAEKLPKVDAIGGSAAGVYVDNKVRIASLFRGVSEEDFKEHVESIFIDLKKEWNDIPFVVVNDGEVTALAGAMSMNSNAVLGISMGTSEAAGYVTPDGNITDWLNELAFVPVDYRDNGPADEWSGDIGCGVQYFSQQAVARLAPLAGIEFSDDMPFPERLEKVQQMMADGDERAKKIYETIGVYFAYTIAYYAEFYSIRNLLILGRVTSGDGGNMILSKAEEVLKAEFPELGNSISFRTPDEQSKRHGQAVTAASLPSLK